MSNESRRTPALVGRRKLRGVRVLAFPAPASPADASRSEQGEHLTLQERASALQIAGYVGRRLASRGPLRSA